MPASTVSLSMTMRPASGSLFRIGLVRVVRRVADDDADLARVLAPDARHVLLADAAEQVVRDAVRRGVQADVVERVDEAQVPELLVLAADRGVDGLDVRLAT
jgi:hypothetical protein